MTNFITSAISEITSINWVEECWQSLTVRIQSNTLANFYHRLNIAEVIAVDSHSHQHRSQVID
jgi:hypothetical protein